MSKRVSLIIGAALAIFAVVLIRVYLDQQRQAIEQQEKQKAAQEQEAQVPVLVAKEAIPAGKPVEAGQFEIRVAPAKRVPPQVASSYSQIAGMETAAPIEVGEPLMLTKLIPSRKAVSEKESLAVVTPVGKRALTIPVDNIGAVGGMLKPGDSVDILCKVAAPSTKGTKADKKDTRDAILPLFQNVLVLAVGQQIGREPLVDAQGKPVPLSPTVTLALEPAEASMTAFAQEHGSIRLVLRSPTDAQLSPVPPITWETLLRYFMPSELPPEEQPKKKEEPQGYIEIYRGLEKGTIPIAK